MQENDIKQVIILRTDLNMRKGKMCAQASHASMKVFFDKICRIKEDYVDLNAYRRGEAYYVATMILTEKMKEWVEGQFKKIVVGVESEEELMKLYHMAIKNDLPYALIEDNGLTEFHGVKTKTALAIGPDKSEKIDEITKDLKLL